MIMTSYCSSIGVIHKERPHQGGRGLPNADANVNFYLWKAKICGHRGEGAKTVKFCGRPLWMAPNIYIKYIFQNDKHLDLHYDLLA